MGKLGPSSVIKNQSRYHHMMPEDTIIWRKFIRNGLYLPEKVWYDVRVGAGIEVPEDQPEWIHRMADYSYRKRIDVVWKKGVEFWVVEVKPKAGIMALGQIIYYTEAFGAEYVPNQPVISGIITDQVDQDVKSIFQEIGVVVFEVGGI